jgi:hypothetical protein
MRHQCSHAHSSKFNNAALPPVAAVGEGAFLGEVGARLSRVPTSTTERIERLEVARSGFYRRTTRGLTRRG